LGSLRPYRCLVQQECRIATSAIALFGEGGRRLGELSAAAGAAVSALAVAASPKTALSCCRPATYTIEGVINLAHLHLAGIEMLVAMSSMAAIGLRWEASLIAAVRTWRSAVRDAGDLRFFDGGACGAGRQKMAHSEGHHTRDHRAARLPQECAAVDCASQRFADDPDALFEHYETSCLFLGTMRREIAESMLQSAL
jgi:hypothetical protein